MLYENLLLILSFDFCIKYNNYNTQTDTSYSFFSSTILNWLDKLNAILVYLIDDLETVEIGRTKKCV